MLQAALLPLLWACGHDGEAGRASTLWREVSVEAGIDIPLVSGGDLREKRTILEVNGNGVGLFDVDGDGDLDLLLVDGTTLERVVAAQPVAHHLLLNERVVDGIPRFRQTSGHGLESTGWPAGLAVADVDRDGRPDVVIGGWGEDALFLNRTEGSGAPRFEKRPLPGRSSPRDWTASLGLADADGDGWLDLYLARYLGIDPAHPPLGQVGDLPCRFAGHPVMCGPHGLPAQPDVFLRGLPGPPWFEDATAASGVGDADVAYGLGVLFGDLDDDGLPDVYVANDSVDNFVLRNDGAGHFQHVGRLSGAASDRAGRAQAGMGVAAGDVDADGDLDLVVTNFSDEANALYRNDGHMLFRETSAASGTGFVSRPLLGWGVQLVDFDGDGALDLFVANGHVYPEADLPGTGTHYAQPLLFQRGRGDGTFEESPSPLDHPVVARGCACGDLDGDGDLDLVVLLLDGAPLLLLNQDDTPARHLLVTLEDVPPHAHDALGSVLRLRVDGRWQCALRLASSGFQATSDPRLHFGGGGTIDAARVRWAGGEEEILDPSSFRFGHALRVRHGQGVVASQPLRSAP